MNLPSAVTYKLNIDFFLKSWIYNLTLTYSITGKETKVQRVSITTHSDQMIFFSLKIYYVNIKKKIYD